MELYASQTNDDTLSVALQANLNSEDVPQAKQWNKAPLYRYRHFWYQLKIIDDALYCQYRHNPTYETVTLPVLSPNLHKDTLIKS